MIETSISAFYIFYTHVNFGGMVAISADQITAVILADEAKIWLLPATSTHSFHPSFICNAQHVLQICQRALHVLLL